MRVEMYAEGVLTPQEQALAKRLLETLHRAYPGHPWGVEINGALVTIRNRSLGQWGYRINLLMQHSTAALERATLMGAGECLERFFQPRGAPRTADLATLPRNARGAPVPPDNV